jgi:ribosomal protein L37AE/L43A
MEALEQYLDTVAVQMGAFLRGFDNPRIHVGSKAGFIREFRKVMDLPALGQPGHADKISYAKAAISFRVSMPSAEGATVSDPVSTLVRGLHEAAHLSGETRRELPLNALTSQLISLLRVPIMVYYLAIADRKRFFNDAKRMAGSRGLPLVALEEMPEKGRVGCPQCQSQLLPARYATILQCGKCGQQFEFVRSLPMVAAVAALVSYEMLRGMVALDVVVSYQEEGKIVPLEFGSRTA